MLDGSVLRIGGIKQKTIGDRAVVASTRSSFRSTTWPRRRQHADGLRIVPVTTVSQAVQALSKLP